MLERCFIFIVIIVGKVVIFVFFIKIVYFKFFECIYFVNLNCYLIDFEVSVEFGLRDFLENL